MPDENLTRLGHFLAGFELSAGDTEKVYDRVHRASCSTDDPLAITIAMNVITEQQLEPVYIAIARIPSGIRRASKTVSDELAKNTDQFLQMHARSLSKTLAFNADEAMSAAISKVQLKLERNAALRAVSFAVLFTAVASGGAYSLGRHKTVELTTEYEALAARTDAAKWSAIVQGNGNIDHIILRDCKVSGPNYLPQPSGRAACRIPLFLDDGYRTVPEDLSGGIRGTLATALVGVPWWLVCSVALGISFFLGVAFRGILVWLKDFAFVRGLFDAD